MCRKEIDEKNTYCIFERFMFVCLWRWGGLVEAILPPTLPPKYDIEYFLSMGCSGVVPLFLMGYLSFHGSSQRTLNRFIIYLEKLSLRPYFSTNLTLKTLFNRISYL